MENMKSRRKEFDIDEFLKMEPPEEILESAQSYVKLMMCYRCAIKEVETKLQVLNEEFSLQYNRNPFESIKSRVKSSYSTLEKLKRKGYEINVKNIEENLSDVAGIRVVCSFKEDIYHIEKMLAKQDDIIVLERKDYIEKSYDGIIYPDIENTPPKFAISKRNEWIINQSDFVIGYVQTHYGGAYNSLLYAHKHNKPYINLYKGNYELY